MNADLDHVIRSGRTPHGYTLAVWATGMLCVNRHGLPDLADALLFTVAATMSLGTLRRCADGGASAMSTSGRIPSESMARVHSAALPGAVLSAWLLAGLPEPWCWVACSSGVTVTLVLLHAAQDALWRWHAGKSRPAAVAEALMGQPASQAVLHPHRIRADDVTRM